MCVCVYERDRDARKPSQIRSLISTQRMKRRGEDKVRELGGTQISRPVSSNIQMGRDRRGEDSRSEWFVRDEKVK